MVSHLRCRIQATKCRSQWAVRRSRTGRAGLIRLPWLPQVHIYEPTLSAHVTSSDTPQGVCLQVFGSMDHPQVSHQARCTRSSPDMPTNCGSPVSAATRAGWCATSIPTTGGGQAGSNDDNRLLDGLEDPQRARRRGWPPGRPAAGPVRRCPDSRPPSRGGLMNRGRAGELPQPGQQ